MNNNWQTIDDLILNGWTPITIFREKIELAKWIDESNKDKGYKIKSFEINYDN